MFGLGWYLDVVGSDSHVLVEFLRVFEEKLRRGKTKVGLLCRSEGTHAAAKLFTAAKQNDQNGHPQVRSQCFAAVKALFIEAKFSNFVPKALYSYADSLRTLINYQWGFK